jgi:queuine/archaeosine tRNA-ribosyltransferase
MSTAHRIISVGPHALDVPVFFASYRLSDYPTSGLKCLPWRLTKTEAVLINAYDFTSRKHQAWLNNGWCLDNYLKLGKHPVLIDSGAYYFLKDNEVGVSPTDVLRIQMKSKAHVGVVLDHPFPPEAVDKTKRINTTIANTEVMVRELSRAKTSFGMMAAIHGHSRRAITGCINRLRRLEDKYGFPVLEHVGIGSLAPLAQRGQAQTAIEIVHQVRMELPRSQIHCFSMGSALLMLMAFYAGADSVDSQSWIISAGFKLAQLPGHYVVRMGKREYRTPQHFSGAMRRFGNRMQALSDEEGFSVKNWTSGARVDLSKNGERRDYVDSLVDLVSNEHVHNRACHNLWVYNSEVRSYRRAERRGTLDHFIAKRLSGTRYEAAFAYAQTLRHG